MLIQKTKYLIGYDLRKPGKNYEDLLGRLRQLGGVRILASQWTLASAANAAQVRDDLRRFMDNNDGIIVFGNNGDWAYAGILESDRFEQIIIAA